jgi:hypothetical protein
MPTAIFISSSLILRIRFGFSGLVNIQRQLGDIRELLSVVVADNKTGELFLDCPRGKWRAGIVQSATSPNGLQRVLLACRVAGVIPAVAMRQFVTPIGAPITNWSIARNNQMAGTIAGPSAGVGMHASAGASFARFR